MSEIAARRALLLLVAANTLLFFVSSLVGTLVFEHSAAFFPKNALTDSVRLLIFHAYGAPALTIAGALVLGLAYDRVSQRGVLVAAFVLTGLGALGLAATPAYTAIGPLATVSYFVCRGLVDFGFAGALGPLAVYVLEAAPRGGEALHIAYVESAAAVGAVAANLGPMAFIASYGRAALDSGGWRVLFVIGAALLLVAWPLWRAIAAAPPPEPERGPPIHPSVRMLLFIGILTLSGALMISRLQLFGTYDTARNFFLDGRFVPAMGIAVALCAVAGNILGGWFCDRHGRRLVIRIPAVLMLVAFGPIVYAIVQSGAPLVYLAGLCALSALAALSRVALITALAEALPAKGRALCLALMRALPSLLIVLITGRSNRSITYGEVLLYGMLAIAGVWVLFALPETAPAKVPDSEVFT
jgi:MFS family permease